MGFLGLSRKPSQKQPQGPPPGPLVPMPGGMRPVGPLPPPNQFNPPAPAPRHSSRSRSNSRTGSTDTLIPLHPRSNRPAPRALSRSHSTTASTAARLAERQVALANVERGPGNSKQLVRVASSSGRSRSNTGGSSFLSRFRSGSTSTVRPGSSQAIARRGTGTIANIPGAGGLTVSGGGRSRAGTYTAGGPYTAQPRNVSQVFIQQTINICGGNASTQNINIGGGGISSRSRSRSGSCSGTRSRSGSYSNILSPSDPRVIVTPNRSGSASRSRSGSCSTIRPSGTGYLGTLYSSSSRSGTRSTSRSGSMSRSRSGSCSSTGGRYIEY